MIFFLVLISITLVLLLVFWKNCKKKDNELYEYQLKSTKSGVSIEEIKVPENKDRITIKILFYPESDREIRVSAHSFIENKWYTYYQEGVPYQSDEIEPKLVSSNTNYKDILEKYHGTIETEKVIYTSSENISHTQTFNTIKGSSNIYILMKFSGNYKITIT